MTPSRALRLIVCLVLVSTVGCDQVTKHLARTQLTQSGSVTLPGGLLEFTLAENPGAFLSLGAALPAAGRGVLYAATGLGLLAMLAYLVGGSRFRWLSFAGMLLACSGGVSNLLDRSFRHGLVSDFMLIRMGPLHTGIFNLADVVIMIGVIVLIVASSRRHFSVASGPSNQEPEE
jgi:signal peptidase II